MRDLVLVDAQAARVRVFREAIAVYGERLRRLRPRSGDAAPAVHGFAAAKAARPERPPEDELRLHVFPSSEEAMKFLRRTPPYAWAPRPAVVFTDLYLDGGSGLALVEELKADPELGAVPAVVLCSGASARLVRLAWEAGSNAVVDLPPDGPGMRARVAATLEFWLREAAG